MEEMTGGGDAVMNPPGAHGSGVVETNKKPKKMVHTTTFEETAAGGWKVVSTVVYVIKAVG